jgi:hypothetical protein
MRYKEIALTFILLAEVSFNCHAQNTDTQKAERRHNVIMQVTDGDSLTQMAVIGQLRNIKKLLPEAAIEVVCHANALDMLLKTSTKVASHLTELKQKNISFLACENTMARKKVTVQDLVPEAGTVPSALVEIILKQEERWSYIKGGH